MCLDSLPKMMTTLYGLLGTGPNAFQACLILRKRSKTVKPADPPRQDFGSRGPGPRGCEAQLAYLSAVTSARLLDSAEPAFPPLCKRGNTIPNSEGTGGA